MPWVTFGDGDGLGVQLVEHIVGEHEVDNGFKVDSISKVFLVVARESVSDTVVEIHHAGDTIKAETIKAILLHVEAQVAQQKAHGLVAVVVEQTRVPKVMSTLAAFVEVLVITSVKVVKSVQNVLAGVRVDNVEKNRDPHSMSSVNQLLELLRRTFSFASINMRTGKYIWARISISGIGEYNVARGKKLP